MAPAQVETVLTECLAQDHSCRTAVATAKDRGWLPPSASPDTGASCQARDALATQGLQSAVEHTAQALDACVSPKHLWQGRRVGVVDSTGITLPDTEANQDDDPQPPGQKPGYGFPVLHLITLMSLATGAVSHYSTGALYDHEERLFQELCPHLSPGKVVLGDRRFANQ